MDEAIFSKRKDDYILLALIAVSPFFMPIEPAEPLLSRLARMEEIAIKQTESVQFDPSRTLPPRKETKTYVITAYTAGYESTGKRKSDEWYGITASGKRVKKGVTVACPPSMPFGTVVEIEGLGRRVCEDRGGAIKGNRLDVYMKSKEKALKFGRQTREVRIIEEESE